MGTFFCILGLAIALVSVPPRRRCGHEDDYDCGSNYNCNYYYDYNYDYDYDRL